MSDQYVPPLLILKASAGSGKTFRLTLRFLALLFSGHKKYRNIMAVTFTNKATAEMKKRILSVLKGLAEENSPDEKDYLDELKKLYPEFSEEDIRNKAKEIYRQILHDYGRLTITTIDKFVQQIIRSFTFELGINPGYEITLNTRQVSKDLSELLHHSLDDNKELLHWITKHAIEKINSGEGWNYQNTLENFAKEIYTENFQNFDESIRQKDIPQIFQNIQTKISDLKQKFEKVVKQKTEEIAEIVKEAEAAKITFKGASKSPFTTFFKKPEDILKDITQKGIARLRKPCDNYDEWFTTKNQNEASWAVYQELNPILRDFVTSVEKQLASYIFCNELDKNIYYLRLVLEMSRLLKEYRVANNLLLISDASFLLKGITQGLEDNPSFIWEKVGSRYQHFLFDEFQDTSRNQWNNFLPLVKNALAESGGQKVEHLIVGDVKQSIYRWRGGDWNILLNQAEQALGKGFIDVQSLQVNFRSEENILKFNNLMFKDIAQWLQQNINGVIAEVGNEQLNSYWQQNNFHHIIESAYADVAQELPAKKTAGKGIVDWKIYPVENNKYRPSQILDDVLKDTSDKLFRWIVEEKRYTPGQIGILVRGNKEALTLMEYLKSDLQSRGHANAYQALSGESSNLKTHPAIDLIINTFRYFLQPAKNKKYYQSICAFQYHLYKTAENPQELSAEDWLQIGHSRIKELKEYLPDSVVQGTDYLTQLPLAELVEELIMVYGLDNNENSLPYLFTLRDNVAQFSQSGKTGLTDFLDWWDTQDSIQLPSSEENTAIQIMTIHKAKGLAFDVVMLPFLNWELVKYGKQNLWADTTDTPFDEISTAPVKFSKTLATSAIGAQFYKDMLYQYMDAINLLYVALTRPKKHLWLCITGRAQRELTTYSISDVISTILDKNGHEQLNFPEQTIENIQPKNEHKGDWQMRSFPTAQHLKKQLDKNTQNKIQRINNDENIRIGTAVHEILSQCQNADDIQLPLNRMLQEGWFSEKEKPLIEKTALGVLENSRLKKLLQKPYRSLNEREIMDKDGRLYRPDKVLLGADETIIIDYKFGNEKEDHIIQVDGYKQLYSEMGYPNVKGFLFYGFQRKLVEV